jgi:CO/xanthine dehydrogenase Mo-binding subunit
VTDAPRFRGKTHAVHDAREKVTGRRTYGADLSLPGMLYARLVLSSVAHAIVGRIDVSRATIVPGVVEVFTHESSPDRTFNRARRIADAGDMVADERLLARRVRFVGDRVAAVVATSERAAKTAASLVHVEYEQLSASLTVDDALREGAPAVGEHGNLISEHRVDRGNEVSAAEGDIETVTTTATQRIHHASLDPYTCLADCDEAGRVTVWSPSQSAFGVRLAVADLLELGVGRVRVVKIPVGGSFGGRAEFYLEPVVAFLALALRRPVRLTLDREQCLAATYGRPPTLTTVKTLVSRGGTLKRFEADTTVDAGGYAGSGAGYAEEMTTKVPRLYRVGCLRHRSRAVYTNTPVTGGMRGWGGPEVLAPTEIHLDTVARRLAMDPVELRLRNLVHPGDVEPVTGVSLGDARVRECLERGAELFDWRARHAQEGGGGRLRRGVGVACGAHVNGLFGSSSREGGTMTLSLSEDGGAVLNASLHEVGCGVVTVMQIIVGEVLGLDPTRVIAGEADTDRTPYDQGGFASRVTYANGAVALAAAEELRARLLDAASLLFETPRESLRLEDGCVLAGPEGRRIPYRDIVVGARSRLGIELIVTTTHAISSNPGAYSVQFAEVEVDTLTGRTRVTDLLAVNDVGCALNLGMVVGQVQGAVAMGIGYALSEHLSLDEEGRVPPGGFKNYHLVNAPDAPEVNVVLVEHPGDEGPFGAKSVGEVSMVPTAPAVVNAVNHALGTAIFDLPATPERVLFALTRQTNEMNEARR